MTEILLGHDRQTKHRITIEEEDRLTSTYVIGTNGTGKSTLLANLIVQDIQAGLGLCLLDPHGDLTKDVLMRIPDKRLADVILLDPIELAEEGDYFGLNLFECRDITNIKYYQHAYAQVMQVFKKLWGPGSENPSWGPQLEDLLSNITVTMIENQGYTFAEIPRLLRNEAFRRQLVNKITNSQVRAFWEDEYNPLSPRDQRDMSFSTLNKVRSLTINPLIHNIVAQSESTIDFRKIMDEGKILLVSLSVKYSEAMTTLLGSLIIGQLLTAALSRTDTKRRQFNLYADEFQRFATPDFATLLTEARKFGIATTIAHQVREQLDEKNAAMALNAGSILVFHVTSEDADELAPTFDLTPKQAILPPGTVPHKVLPLLEHHAHSIVKSFWRNYVLPLEQALKKQERERRSTNFLGDEITDTILPKHDFGMGMVEYRTDDVQGTYNLLNDLFYEVMRNSQIDQEKEVKDLLAAFATLLKFQDFYDWHNLGKPWDMKPYLIKITLEAIEQTATLEEEIAKINGYLTNDDTLVQHLLGGHVLRDNAYIALSLDECYADLKKQANLHTQTVRELGSFAGFVETLRKGVAHQLAELEKERERLLKNIRLTPSQELRLWYHKNVKYGTKNMYYQIDYDREELIRIEAKIATLKQELASEEVLLEEWQKADYPSGARKKGIRVAIAETLASHAENVAYYQQTDTPEKYLAYERRKLEQKRDEKLGAIESINTHRQHEYERTRKSLDFQKQIYLAFVTELKKVIEILTTKEGRVKIQSTTWQDQPTSQQTYADRRNQIANELTQMPPYTAHVKLPRGEHIIKTIPPGTSRQERMRYDEKRTQVVKQTRENYCTPRAEIEEQIRHRQDNNTPSPIKRTHSL